MCVCVCVCVQYTFIIIYALSTVKAALGGTCFQACFSLQGYQSRFQVTLHRSTQRLRAR